jgi:hypothetical protein
MSTKIDIFCDSCLPAEMSDQAKTRVLTQAPQFFFGQMIALLAFLASRENADSATTPVAVPVNVTAAGVTLAAANATPRFVSVVNNSADKTILISDGAAPHFADSPTPVSNLGIPLGPGDVWESPAPITTAVRGVAAATESAYCTVIEYTPA